MRFSFIAGASASFFFGLTVASPAPNRVVPNILPRQTIIPGGEPCGQNNATNRRCWKNNWNITTDYEVSYPPAFNTRVYKLVVTNITSWTGPDGVQKHVMLINNTFPGPTLEADWGDYMQVEVVNQLQDNGTNIHWHGIRQFGESDQDGANGITECPIPPGASKTYAFHVTQYGTSWYHSHFSSQYGNGVVGALMVRGPTSANWDIDLGPYVITDYYWDTADNLQRRAELTTGGPPDSDNILMRGKNVHPTITGQGSYDRITLTPGKKHLLRLINTSVDNSFTVSLVGHTFEVVANDLVPINPINKTQLFMAVGQRYDVVVRADQAVDNYWLNVTLSSSNLCGTSRNKFPAAVFHYDGASSGNPTNQGTPITAGCADETGMVPVVPRQMTQAQFMSGNTKLPVSLTTPTVPPLGQVFRWTFGTGGTVDRDIDIDWAHPTLEYVMNRSTSYPPNYNIIEAPQRNQISFWIVENRFLLPHPLHLHGHDQLLLGVGTGTFDPATMAGQLTYNNPVRRDVIQMPGNGWVVIGFVTDNPGCWLLHCHIGWHISQGLGVQFLERRDEIARLMHLDQMVPNCQAWRQYAPNGYWMPKNDSGL